MNYEFYLDLYFLENLVINYTVLRMIVTLERKHCPRVRSFLAAAGASLMVCLGMITGMYRIRSLTAVISITAEILMTLAAWPWRGWKTFMYRAVIFRLLSLLAEGSWQILRYYFHMPFPYSMAAGILLPFFVLLMIRKKEEKERLLYTVTIKLHGKENHIQALWDSGNHLSHPVTGRPVHILDAKALKPLLTMQESLELQALLELKTTNSQSGTFSLIPYQSIGKKYGLLPVLQLDEICVETEKEIIRTPKVLAAVSGQTLSQKGEWQMILHQNFKMPSG